MVLRTGFFPIWWKEADDCTYWREIDCVVNLCWLESEFSFHCYDWREPFCPRRHWFSRISFVFSIFLPNRLRFVAMCYRVTNPSGESEWPSASYSIFLVDFRRFLLEFATTLLQVGSSSDHIACNWYLFSSSWFHLKFVITWPNRVVFTDSSSYSPLSKSWSFLPTTRTSSRRSAFLVGSTARTRPRTRRRGRRRNRNKEHCVRRSGRTPKVRVW